MTISKEKTRDMSDKIYESPDGGKTVYSRNMSETERTLEHVDQEFLNSLLEGLDDDLWRDIRREAKKNESLEIALERVKIIYHMSKENGR